MLFVLSCYLPKSSNTVPPINLVIPYMPTRDAMTRRKLLINVRLIALIHHRTKFAFPKPQTCFLLQKEIWLNRSVAELRLDVNVPLLI